MQVVRPIDIEDSLRVDVAEFLVEQVTCCAPPAPDDLAPGTVCFTTLGGAAQSVVSHEYDLSVDCWASTIEGAVALANEVQGIVSTLPYRTTTSGRHYVTSSPMTPYINPDPRRPLIPRCTFRATVGIRGIDNL